MKGRCDFIAHHYHLLGLIRGTPLDHLPPTYVLLLLHVFILEYTYITGTTDATLRQRPRVARDCPRHAQLFIQIKVRAPVG